MLDRSAWWEYEKTFSKHAVTQKNVVRQLGGWRENKQNSRKGVSDGRAM